MQFVFDIYEDEGILMIILAVIALELIVCGYQLILCIIGLDFDQGLMAVKYIFEKVKLQCIVIVYDKQ